MTGKEKMMTIKEVEKQLGIPRATIRFYEKNGLITPARNENSYRAYSEEDVAELRRIIILRKIGISVLEIGDLQKGNADFSDVLSVNLERLNKQLKEVTGAINICKKFQVDGTSMTQLSQINYWENVKQEEESGNLFMSIVGDIYIVGKHSFLSNFGIEDSEGNCTKDAKGAVLTVLINCLACGVLIAIFEAVFNRSSFSLSTFKEGFVWPFIIAIYVFFIELPFYFLGKNHPVLAKKIKK